jgi:hypothetical protein
MSTTTTNLTPTLTNIATQSKQTMTSLWENTSKLMSNLDETFQTYLLFMIIIIIVICYLGYLSYVAGLQSSECSYMNRLYPDVDGYIVPISNTSDYSHKLFDYYIKTAYNACSGGSYKNDYVDICNLKSIIKQGVRCLDFEVYSMDNQPVVASSTSDSYYVKETYNSVPFSKVMEVIDGYAFANGTAPNPTDPIILHLRIKSTKQEMYSNLASLFSNYKKMLGLKYSYINTGKNIGMEPLLSFQNKIILIVDGRNDSFLENEKFLEYVNLTSSSIFMRTYHSYDIKNNPDIYELTDFNRSGMTIVLPDKEINPANPNGLVCRNYGCQMVAMRYQYIDDYLMENTGFFDREGTAFALKPEDLRYQPIVIPEPPPQNSNYSYDTRVVSTEYYTYNI